MFLENSVMFLECLKNNSKILSDVIIMQFGKGVLYIKIYLSTTYTDSNVQVYIYIYVCVYVCIIYEQKFIMAEIMRMRMFKMLLTSVK